MTTGTETKSGSATKSEMTSGKLKMPAAVAESGISTELVGVAALAKQQQFVFGRAGAG